jgi:hypothetical protein
MVFNLFPGIWDTLLTGSHDLVECGQVGHGMGAEGVPEGPPLEDEPPDRPGTANADQVVGGSIITAPMR